MEEQKFNVCNLALNTIVLKIAALKNETVKRLLYSVKMNDEDLSEEMIALDLDDIYEFGILREPDDKCNELMNNLVKALMTELPNLEIFKKKYNWEV